MSLDVLSSSALYHPPDTEPCAHYHHTKRKLFSVCHPSPEPLRTVILLSNNYFPLPKFNQNHHRVSHQSHQSPHQAPKSKNNSNLFILGNVQHFHNITFHSLLLHILASLTLSLSLFLEEHDYLQKITFIRSRTVLLLWYHA